MPPVMSKQALRLGVDLCRPYNSDSSVAVNAPPDESKLHSVCARQLDLRDLD